MIIGLHRRIDGSSLLLSPPPSNKYYGDGGYTPYSDALCHDVRSFYAASSKFQALEESLPFTNDEQQPQKDVDLQIHPPVHFLSMMAPSFHGSTDTLLINSNEDNSAVSGITGDTSTILSTSSSAVHLSSKANKGRPKKETEITLPDGITVENCPVIKQLLPKTFTRIISRIIFLPVPPLQLLLVRIQKNSSLSIRLLQMFYSISIKFIST